MSMALLTYAHANSTRTLPRVNQPWKVYNSIIEDEGGGMKQETRETHLKSCRSEI